MDIKKILSDIYTNSVKLELVEEKENKEFNSVLLCGGLNGIGNWKNYFSNLTQLCTELEKQTTEFWVIDFKNDVLDDIFYVTIGYIK